MELLDSPATARVYSDAQRATGHRVALVPTMGALHAGHLALVDEARKHADIVVVSIFVNPLQFDVRADFDLYPRPIDDDLAACDAIGVDAVYAPTAAAMYPAGFDTHVEPGGIAHGWEGTHRVGHFRGVTTVVAKLLAATRPDVAVFGQKDAQQLAVIRRMVLDLDLGIDVIGVPTIREPDGLALSSRNTRLTLAERTAARCIPSALAAIRHAWHAGERDAATLIAIGSATIAAEPMARSEYLAIVDPVTFESVAIAGPDALVVVATWVGDVRLIDNAAVSSPATP
jgi:pantoate--beta-alanine ligase